MAKMPKVEVRFGKDWMRASKWAPARKGWIQAQFKDGTTTLAAPDRWRYATTPAGK